MLPSLNTGLLSLADVLPSCLASMGVAGFKNRLKLPDVSSCVVVLVDGLGKHNLAQAQAHARFLSSKAKLSADLTTVFPSTTAAALASMATGANPGEHGMAGYRVRDPRSGQILNQLTGLHALDQPAEWLRTSTVFDRAQPHSVRSFVVGNPRFARSTLTDIIYSGAEFIGARTIDDRVSEAVLLAKQQNSLVVLYISELDELAHKHGVASAQWVAELESVDAAIALLEKQLGAEVGLFITADHGIIDIPVAKHYLYGAEQHHVQYLLGIGGEPRCLQLYFTQESTEEERLSTLAAWKADFESLAWVLTREEVEQAGLFSSVTPEVTSRLGDVFVLAKKHVVFYDERDTTLKGRSMVGQHGGISPEEMTIPGIRLAAYSVG